MQCWDAGGVDQAAIEGIDGPGAIELEAAGGAYGGSGDFYGVERFDGMDLDAGQGGEVLVLIPRHNFSRSVLTWPWRASLRTEVQP